MKRIWFVLSLAGALMAQAQTARVTVEDLVSGEDGGRIAS